MDWCRLTSNYYQDAGIVRAGEAAEVLFLRVLAYCASQENGGRFPRAVVTMLAPTKTAARLEALVREQLLLEDGDDLVVRSWDHHQRALDSESERRRKAREKKARQRAGDHTGDKPAPVPGTVPGTKGGTSPGSPRHIEVEGEEEQKTSSSGTRKRATAVPDIFPITDAMKAWGRENAPAVADPQAETRQFLDHHRAKGSTFKDWTAAWRTWMGNAQKFAGQGRGAGSSPRREFAPKDAWLENM